MEGEKRREGEAPLRNLTKEEVNIQRNPQFQSNHRFYRIPALSFGVSRDDKITSSVNRFVVQQQAGLRREDT